MMDKTRVVCAALSGLGLLALQDVLLWQRIFETDGLWDYAGVYHNGWQVSLAAWIIGGFVWMWPNVKRATLHGALVFTLAHSGLEDVFYYLIQLKPIPTELPWLDHAPLVLFSPVTRLTLFASVGLWLAGWALVLWAWDRP